MDTEPAGVGHERAPAGHGSAEREVSSDLRAGDRVRAAGVPLEVITIILAIAMWMALGYVVEVGWKCCVVGTFVAASRNVVWMAPVSAAVLSLALLAPIAAAAMFLDRARARTVAIAAATWLVVFAALLPWTQLHRLATALLAAGIASVAARSLATDRAIARIHRAGLTIATVLLAGGALLTGWRAWEVRGAYASLAAARDGAPNVLILLLDTVRATGLSLYGYERNTSPVLDSLAAGGVTFDHAVSTSPWTLPAHGSLFTGMYPGVMSTSFTEPLDERHPTISEQFRNAGYETIGFTANLHYTAWDSGVSRGFLRWFDFADDVRQVLHSGWLGQMSTMRQLIHARAPWQVREALRQPELEVVPKPGGVDRNAAELVDAILEWHAERPDTTRPWLAFANFFDAHRDYYPPPPWRTRFASDTLHPSDRERYDGEIAFIDHEIGRLTRTLRERGELERTIIVVVADHGEQFGEHRVSGHGNSLYYQVLQVPLVVRWDGEVPAGRRVNEIVSIRDIPATLASLAGVSLPTGFPGASLAPLWGDSSAARVVPSAAISELTQDPMPRTSDPLSRSQGISLVDANGEHGIHRASARARTWLYDVRRDRAETRNLTDEADGLARHREQRRILQALLREDETRHSRR